jgi:hypothetical protein
MRNIEIKSKDFFVGNILVANGYTRVVHGGRGKYAEFHPDSILTEALEVEPNQEYRLTEKWKKLVYYAWYRTKVGAKKVYFQYKKADYADYLPGYYYIALKDLIFEGELYTEKSDKPLD